MSPVRVLILRAAGVNCDREAAHAWTCAGAEVELVHIRALCEQPGRIDSCRIITLPGGFSYGDDLGAGRILAAQIERYLADALHRFVERGGLLLGICNGFQVLVKAGFLPERAPPRQRACTITFNQPAGFQDRWVRLRAADTPCAFLEPGREYEMPIAHGEGRVVFRDDALAADAVAQRRAALLYAPSPDAGDERPYNPNGSTADIAGLTDATGRVLGLMPHPDRFVEWTQHPCWTSLPERPRGDGLALFERGVAHVRGSR
ncbi:MAG: phosphoribosylformylglycinamidine synthase subunit PurQ [Phycisphaerae bacterium]